MVAEELVDVVVEVLASQSELESANVSLFIIITKPCYIAPQVVSIHFSAIKLKEKHAEKH